MERENEGGYNPSNISDREMELGKRKQELFEDNVNKLVKRFTGKEDKLRKLMAEKETIAEDKNHTEDHEHLLYEIRTFKEALQRIEEKEKIS